MSKEYEKLIKTLRHCGAKPPLLCINCPGYDREKAPTCACATENMEKAADAIEELGKSLAAYEDTGLTPEEIGVIKSIVGRLATADYPHNFQREREDIVAYMYWITDILKDAKTWWKGMVTRKEGQ